MANISIGQLSERGGVKVPTIRYYEQIGLLAAPSRTEGKQRRYDEVHVQRLSFIRQARELGFEVDAIRELIGLEARHGRSRAEIDSLVRNHLDAVQSRIDRLLNLREALKRAIEQPAEAVSSEIGVIQALVGRGPEMKEA